VVARKTGEVRYFVREHSDATTCLEVVGSTVPAGAAILYTDEWKGYARVEAERGNGHGSVKHGRDDEGQREWARDDDGDGLREVHCNTCEGAGTGLRTYLRGFRGVHKYYLAEYVATYETMTNAKSITPEILQRMCFGINVSHSNYT
jgi:hypothetical protein